MRPFWVEGGLTPLGLQGPPLDKKVNLRCAWGSRPFHPRSPGLWGLRPGRVLPSCRPSPACHSNRHRKWPHRARERRAWGGDSWGHKPGAEVAGCLAKGTARLQARARLRAELGWWGCRARGVRAGRGGCSRTPVRPPRPAAPCLPSGPSAPLPTQRVTPTPSRSPSRGPPPGPPCLPTWGLGAPPRPSGTYKAAVSPGASCQLSVCLSVCL